MKRKPCIRKRETETEGCGGAENIILNRYFCICIKDPLEHTPRNMYLRFVWWVCIQMYQVRPNFLKVVIPVFPPTMSRELPYSSSLLTLHAAGLCHCEMVSLCGFNLHFSDWHEIKQLFMDLGTIHVCSSVTLPPSSFAGFSWAGIFSLTLRQSVMFPMLITCHSCMSCLSTLFLFHPEHTWRTKVSLLF